MTVYIIIMLACVIMSAYFSATETAFSSLNKTKLKTLAEEGNPRAALAVKLSDAYDKLISTILIGNNIVNILVASIGTVFFTQLLKDGDMGATMSTVVITVVILIFGEITPKTIAKEYPVGYAMAVVDIVDLLMLVLTPVNALSTLWKKTLGLVFKFDNDDSMSQEELLTIVEEATEDGDINERDGNWISNASEFNE